MPVPQQVDDVRILWAEHEAKMVLGQKGEGVEGSFAIFGNLHVGHLHPDDTG